MIAETDILRLAPGVTVADGMLADFVRGDRWPLNRTGVFVLDRAGEPVGVTARSLAATFSLSSDRARNDVLQFVWLLNGLALVNIDPVGPRLRRLVRWLSLAVRLAPVGALPAPLARRRRLETGTVARAVTTCLVAVLPRSAVAAGLATAVTAQFALIMGTASIGLAVAVGLGTGAGLGLHEAAHAGLLTGVPSALVTRGRRTYVLHRSLSARRRVIVAAGAPLAVALLGVACISLAAATALPMLAFGGCPLAGHALALTVLGGDGRVACGD